MNYSSKKKHWLRGPCALTADRWHWLIADFLRSGVETEKK